jgi:hypothetical protein
MNPRPYLHYQNDANDKERDRRFLPSENRLDEPDADAPDNADDLDLELDMSQGGLPHIPLRPFRNQVGGHSAIYKFTKRAVCKVRRISFPSPHCWSYRPMFLDITSRLYRVKTCSTSR